MAETVRVVMYGNSIFLAGVGARLRRYSELEVLTVEPERAGAAACMRRLHPAAILIDLAAAQVGSALALLRDRPELVVLAIDPSSEKVLLLSRRPQPPLAAGLLHLVLGSGDSTGALAEVLVAGRQD